MHANSILLFVILCIFGSSALAHPAWHRGPPLVFAETSAISVGRKVIFYNGKVGGVDMYDSISDTWGVGPPLRAQRNGGYAITAAILGEKVIFAGGQLNDYASTDVVDIYDSNSDSWSIGERLPEERSFAVATSVDGNAIFVGHPFAQFLALAPRIYNVQNGSWSAGPDIARGRSSNVAAATTGSKGVFAGGSGAGSSFSTPSPAVDIYESSTNEWRDGPSLPGAYTALAATTTIDDRALFGGGFGQNGTSDFGVPILEPSNTVFLYNITSDGWNEIGSLLTANGSSLATTVGVHSLFINGATRAMDIFDTVSNTIAVGPMLVFEASSVASIGNSTAVAVGKGVTQLYVERMNASVSNTSCSQNLWTVQPPIPFVPSTVSSVGNQTIFPQSDFIFSAVYNPDNNGSSEDAWLEGPSGVGKASHAVTIGSRAYFLTEITIDYYLRIYDSENDTLREVPGFILSNYSFSAAAGAGDKAIFASDQFYIFDTHNESWSTGPATERVASIAATSVGTKAIFVGGITGSSLLHASDRVDIYDSSTEAFSVGPPLAGGARYFMAATSVGTKALFVGGQQQIDTSPSGRPIFAASNAVDMYDSVTDTWSSGPPLAGGPRFAIVVITIGTKAIFAGGFNGSAASRAVDIYDSLTDSWTLGAPLLEGGAGLAAALNSTSGIFVISEVVQIYTEAEQVCNNDTLSPPTTTPLESTTSPPTTPSESSAVPSTTPTNVSPSSSPTSQQATTTDTSASPIQTWNEETEDADTSSAARILDDFFYVSVVLICLKCIV